MKWFAYLASVVVLTGTFWLSASSWHLWKRRQRLRRIEDEATRTFEMAQRAVNFQAFLTHQARHEELWELWQEEARK